MTSTRSDLTVVLNGDMLAQARDEFRAAFPGISFLAPTSKDEVLRTAPEADAIITVYPKLPAGTFAAARRLRWVQVLTVGVNTLLTEELVAHPCVLTNARGAHTIPVAEHAVALMLALARRLPAYFEQQREKLWKWIDNVELEGATLGMIGYGSIGEAIAARAAAFGMRVLATARRPRAGGEGGEGAAPGAGPAVEWYRHERLHEMLAASDFVVVAVPLTPDTKGMLGAAELRAMKPGAILINIARGAVIDEAALIDALRSGHVGAAGLDVFETEPLPPSSPLWTMPNVIVTPHVASRSESPPMRRRLVRLAIENLARFQRGEPLLNVVDKQVGY